MTNTEHLMAIAAEVGVNVDELPDTLETTLLKAIIEKSGGDTSMLPDNLKSTLYTALAECAGGGGGSIDELKANGQIGYTETQEVEVIPEQTIEVAMNEDVGAPVAVVAPAYDFSGVQKVRVLFDGVEYICVPANGIFGNQVFVGGEDTGEPFVYGCVDSTDPSSAGFFVAAEGTHTVSVTAISEVAHPMDEKYVPPISGVLSVVRYHNPSHKDHYNSIEDNTTNAALDAIPLFTPIIFRYSSPTTGVMVGVMSSYESGGGSQTFYGNLRSEQNNYFVIIEKVVVGGWRIAFDLL